MEADRALEPIYNYKCPFHGNGRVYVVSEAAALRQFLCFLPVLGTAVVCANKPVYRQPRDETLRIFKCASNTTLPSIHHHTILYIITSSSSYYNRTRA